MSANTILTDLAQTRWLHCCQRHPALEQRSDWHARCLEVFGLSTFVARSVEQDPALLEWLFDQQTLEDGELDYPAIIAQTAASADSPADMDTILRHLRRRFMVHQTWRDLTGRQPIEHSLAQVSAMADALIMAAYHWAYEQVAERFGRPQTQHGDMPLLILGMGKLGGRELNFSSDIDLIFAYPFNGKTQGGRREIDHHGFFIKVAQKLIATLHQTTAQGQVFRVDMRLRPFGDSGPLVSPFAALEDYYQDQGREWERYAMSKARIINPVGPYHEELNNILRPFTYRRYLDFGAIESLRNMKAQINQEVRRRRLSNNIKLGAGGIREVEFIVQSFQLIRGGRDPHLRQPPLLANLAYLATTGALQPEEAAQLRQHYLLLRKVEHCLQQMDDQQTQELPDTDSQQAVLAAMMQAADYSTLRRQIDNAMKAIHEEFQALIGDPEDEDSEERVPSPIADLWRLSLTAEESAERLSEWLDAEHIETFGTLITECKAWRQQRGMGQRGQDTLDELMPHVLWRLLSQSSAEPIALFKRIVGVLQAIIGRTTYLQLLNEHHGAIDQLLRLCAASPWLAEQLTSFPILLDELLNPAQLYQATPLSHYAESLRQYLLRVDPDDLELQMEVLRQFKLTEQLRIAAADVTNALPVMKVSDHLTFLAEALIEHVVNLAWQQITERYGQPQGCDDDNRGFAVLGYGKLGGYELGYGSDLDLVFVHDAQRSTLTDGAKAIEAPLFYVKLAQRIMHLFNTKTAFGPLYDVDMRLRPSGNAGLLVCHLNGFAEYQQKEAWTWEHQALVRARFVYGSESMAQRFSAIRREILCQSRPLSTLRQDVVEMREKMRTHLSTSQGKGFDLKQDPGGITDIEFLVQYWVLAHAHQFPQLCDWPDNVRILETAAAVQIITTDQQQTLTEAYLAYRNTSHRLTLQQQSRVALNDAFEATRAAVTEIWHSTFADQASK
ncbi:bifunctional [glutamate--ammonia ligase]-adenylyl-L-tyrosine phosphorylase/[glutamate--ammonia-ligase] adenylyltransferase [Aestuariibacter halophilus]|uniref:Bifunctional glutamine synthetase adenylyltransferase/adenylyl-removing enzyme n=1 Tax=Fluctibacter halophilus TaxID=226011 RepID=A0ABS8G597_9ALTE|nr:bifunctional [glutamate--ammonia ligase]-adenylyl-L-tyrosine phosphorylase/[glutamate--ammonia-ligase] adenylyltransferase [Aestuariibacter halophilus]MCC2614844.1 bifunctional [glutamate--ammonia ligase]-adenylyl-L-tyrosine phosphorylase/[glutamate--ammonia-ligase] adenylyltransferase [Aestuariibacter halophilus]